MNNALKCAVAATLFGLGLSEAAMATDLRWLNYSPVRFFTDKDWDVAKAAGRKALNETEDAVVVEWKNSESGHYGSLTPLSTATKNGMTCRELKIVNHANRLDGSSIYEFCKQSNGNWAAVQGSPN